jgi:excisionase family DNA binding protein
MSERHFDLATHRRPFVTAVELANFVGCDPRTIVRMISVGSLPGVKVGRSWRIPTAAARAAFHVQQTQAY